MPKGELVRRLINNGGNIYELESTSKNIENGTCISDWVQKNVDSLYFKNIGDIFNGLTICVDTVWGYTIEVSDYNLDGTHFSGTLHFKLYDNFGLDRNDVSGTYGLLSGFRSWYVLQHYDRIKGVYVPFVSLMEFDVPFEGNVLTIREAK